MITKAKGILRKFNPSKIIIQNAPGGVLVDELKFEDLGFPDDITVDDLRMRFRSAQQNREQLEKWIDLVLEEIIRRGG